MRRFVFFLGLSLGFLSLHRATGAAIPDFQCGVRAPASLLADWAHHRAKPAAIPASGVKRILFVRVDFSDLPGAPFSDLQGANFFADADQFLADMSAGRVHLAPFGAVGTGSAVTPTLRLPLPTSSYGVLDINKLRDDALAVALAGGFDSTAFDLDVICFGPANGPSFNFSGLANVGSRGAWLRDSFFNGGNLVHELGHNFGLYHANGWNTAGGPPTGMGSELEYADVSDTMSRNTGSSRHYNAQKKLQLGWLTPDQLSHVNTSGLYQVYAHDVTNAAPGPRALIVAHSVLTNYWLELRQKYTDQPSWTQGLAIRWAEESPRPTLLLDATATSQGGFRDAPLLPGWTFSDRATGRHFRNRGYTPATASTPASLSVEIQLGDFPDNQAPTASLNPVVATVGTGTPVTFSVTATDPDEDVLGYGWDFGDGSYGPDAANVTRTFAFAGDYLVRCIVSDGRGGTAVVQTAVRVGTSTTGRLEGLILRPNGTAAGNIYVQLGNLQSTLTDATGRYIFTGLAAGNYAVHPIGEAGVIRPAQRSASVTGSSSTSVPAFTAYTTVDLHSVTLVPAEAAWRYLDDGSNPGTNWLSEGYPDTTWNRGPAPLGYGYSDLATTVSFGPNPAGRWITTYFRRTFTLTHPIEFLEGLLSVQRDDGVLVSLNGHQVARVNLPDGSVNFLTLPVVENSPSESTRFLDLTFDAAVFQMGTNVVTAEIHQWRPSDTDLRFALRLQGLTDTSIEEAPTLLAGPAPLTLTEGQPGTFRVEVAGTEPLTFQWRHDGADILGATQAVLSFGAVAAGDVGNYSCHIANATGDLTSESAPLTLLAVPGIVTSPSDLALNEGSPAIFKVQAAGLAPLRYQWLRNNLIIVGATNDTYRIGAVSPNDAGVYRVIVSNNLGSAPSMLATLSVFQRPRITQAPLGRLILAGQPFTLQVVATGFAPLIYQWFQDGAPLPEGTNSTLTLPGLPALPVTVNFTVNVANIAGSVFSSPAAVTVGFGPIIVSAPTNLTIVVGQSASFALSATGTAPLTYRWLHNSTVLVGIAGAQLDLANVGLADAGIYQVIVGGAAGFVTNTAQLSVLVPPSILTAPLALTRLAGETAELLVEISGSPTPTLQWRKNGTDIPEATTNRLRFDPLNLGDSGSYDVRALNIAGGITSAPVLVTVLDPSQQVAPSIVTGPVGISLAYGAVGKLQVVAAGLPTPTLQWRKAGVDLLDQTNSELTLGPISGDEAGSYTVVASNRNGTTESLPAVVFIGSAPLFNIQPQSANLVAGVNRTLLALISGDFPIAYQWTQNGRPLVGATNSDLTLRSVTELNSGSYRILVSNPYGISTSAPAQIQVFVKPAISSQPLAINVLAGNPATLNVGVTGTAPLVFTWRRGSSVVATLTNDPVLSFPNLTVEQTGSYTVTVANFAGSVVSSAVNVAISVPLGIQRQPTGTNSIAGRAFALSVGVSGDGPISYQWRQNDHTVLNATNAILDFMSLAAADEGNYTVEVRNAVSTIISLAAGIHVAVLSEILIPPTAQTVATGTDVYFDVLASGTEPRTFQWLRDGRRLSDAPNSAQLTLSNATPAISGQYQVIVQNFAGSVTSSIASLRVLDRPIIVVAPINQRVSAGSLAAFSIMATGGEPLIYQWRRHGVNLVGATNASLNFSAVTAGDADEYSVRISNPVGFAISDIVRLDVDVAIVPPVFENLVFHEFGFEFRIRGTVGRSYLIESTSDLAIWAFVKSVPIGADGHATVVLPVLGTSLVGPQFFRARSP